MCSCNKWIGVKDENKKKDDKEKEDEENEDEKEEDEDEVEEEEGEVGVGSRENDDGCKSPAGLPTL